MSDFYILDADGEPVRAELLEWARWFEGTVGNDTRVVARDTVGDVVVSTVFLGLDHGFGLSAEPILWETIVFGGGLDGTGDRYQSRADALAGHADMLARVRAAAGAG